jgi:hypothetical protein
MLVMIFGPKTRLARSLLNSTAWSEHPEFILVARNPEEAVELEAEFPSASVHRPWSGGGALPGKAERVAVICCAIGVIHKGDPLVERDVEAALSDHRALQAIVDIHVDATIHLLMVSSVLALAPRPERDHYAGWKNVQQEWLRLLGRRSPKVKTSILYPGRLVEHRGPRDLLSTSYAGLARKLIVLAEGTEAVERVLGLDARLWLLARSLSLIKSAMVGQR